MDGKLSAEFVTALSAAADRLFLLTANDDQLRNHLRSAAQTFLDATESQKAVAQEMVAMRPKVVTCSQSPTSVVATPTPLLRRRPVTDADLPKIEARCRLKAEATRWAVERQQLLSGGASFSTDIAPRDQHFISRAKADGDCFLWMSRQVQVAQVGHWNDVAASFEVVADAIALMQVVLTEDTRQHSTATDLLAEAQSALRCSIGIVEGPTDSDQLSVYEWLRTSTMERRFLVKRFMRADDPADPDALPDLAARIKALHDSLLDRTKRRKEQEAKFRRIEYHMKSISSGSGTDHDWSIVVNSVDELINDGLPPSNVRLRELLLPYRDDLPYLDGISVGFNRVVQEIERYLDDIAEQNVVVNAPEVVSNDVAAAKELLKEQTALFVGGRADPYAKEALQKALGLKELIWFETEEHKSLDIYEPLVARADVTTVFLAIRWSSHSYGGLKELCKKHGKRFVRLTAGYNPNQVARKVVEQIGVRP